MPTDDRDGVRAVWQSQTHETFRMSAEKLTRQAARTKRALIYTTVAMVIICVGEAVAFTIFYFQVHSALQRVGAVLTALGMGFLILQVHRHFVKMRRIQRTTLAEPSAVYLRAVHEHMRAWSRGRWFWPRLMAIMPGPLLFTLGDALGHPKQGIAAFTMFFVFLALGALAIVLNVVVAVRVIDKKLARLRGFARDE